MTRNDTVELVVEIGNNQYEIMKYTVVVQPQEILTANNSTTVVGRAEIDRFGATIEHNGTHHERHALAPTRTGEDLRVQYLLYEGDAPAEPTRDNAYRDLHLWIDVG